MKKIICIGECSLNIVLDPMGRPLGSMPGGRVTNAAAILAGMHDNKVFVASEVSADPVGDILVDYFSRHGVDISSLDRFTEGRTAVNIFTASESGPVSLTRYEQYPDNCFDIIWPRIDEGDIVLYGGFYTLDHRMRPRMSRFLANCVERKATLIYLPGFLRQQAPRTTHVMPAIFENLEIADIVIADSDELKYIFGSDTPESCYRDHIDFYCRSLIAINPSKGSIDYYTGSEHTSANIPEQSRLTMLWKAGAIAGVVSAVIADDISTEALGLPDATLRHAILDSAVDCAHRAVENTSGQWQHIF